MIGGGKDDLKFFMDEIKQIVILRLVLNFKGSYKCFGFGYNGFVQFSVYKIVSKDDEIF